MTQGDLKLRAIEPEDLDLIYMIENDTSLWQEGCANVPYSRYAIRQFIESSRNDIYADGQIRLVIEKSGCAIGLIDLCNFDVRHSRAEVSIVVLPTYRHQGFGKIALNMLTRHAHDFLHIHTLYAIVAQDNTASSALFLSCGFIHTATLPLWLSSDDGGRTDALVYQNS